MAVAKLYFSIPMTLDLISSVKPFIEKFEKVADVFYWKRHTPYKKRDLIECDLFVLFLPNLQFKCYLRNLPPGCAKELDLAIKEGKDIAIAYKTMEGTCNLYQAEKTELEIRGIGGTTNLVLKLVQDKMNAHRPMQAMKRMEELHIDALTGKQFPHIKNALTGQEISSLMWDLKNKPAIEAQKDRRILLCIK